MPLAEVVIALLFLGVGLGTLGAFIGVGGGFLAVPLLILVYNFSPNVAVGTSLVMVSLSAVSGTVAYLRQGRVDLFLGPQFALVTLPGAVLGAFLLLLISAPAFKVAFGILLTLASIRVIVKPKLSERVSSSPAPAQNSSLTRLRRLTDAGGSAFTYRVSLLKGWAINFAVGFVSSVFGVGGGVVNVPSMVHILGIPVHVAVATSTFILLVTSSTASVSHLSLGNVIPEFALPLGVGAIFGAQLGAKLARVSKSPVVERILGFALAATGIRLVLNGLG